MLRRSNIRQICVYSLAIKEQISMFKFWCDFKLGVEIISIMKVLSVILSREIAKCINWTSAGTFRSKFSITFSRLGLTEYTKGSCNCSWICFPNSISTLFLTRHIRDLGLSSSCGIICRICTQYYNDINALNWDSGFNKMLVEYDIFVYSISPEHEAPSQRGASRLSWHVEPPPQPHTPFTQTSFDTAHVVTVLHLSKMYIVHSIYDNIHQ